MTNQNWLSIEPRNNAAQLETICSLLQYSREQTLRLVKNMTVQQLDEVPANYDNNIGSILKHLCYIERYVQVASFENGFSQEELSFWEGAKTGTMQPVRRWNEPVSYYIDLLNSLRQRSMFLLRGVDDSWLQRETTCRINPVTNQLMMWAHLIEEDFGHAYQIRLLIKKLQASFV